MVIVDDGEGEEKDVRGEGTLLRGLLNQWQESPMTKPINQHYLSLSTTFSSTKNSWIANFKRRAQCFDIN